MDVRRALLAEEDRAKDAVPRWPEALVVKVGRKRLMVGGVLRWCEGGAESRCRAAIKGRRGGDG